MRESALLSPTRLHGIVAGRATNASKGSDRSFRGSTDSPEKWQKGGMDTLSRRLANFPLLPSKSEICLLNDDPVKGKCKRGPATSVSLPSSTFPHADAQDPF